MSMKIHAKLNEAAAKICQKVKQRSAAPKDGKKQEQTPQQTTNSKIALAINKRMKFYHQCVPTEGQIRERLERALRKAQMRIEKQLRAKAEQQQQSQQKACKDKATESTVSSVTVTLNNSYYEKLRQPSVAMLKQEKSTLKQLKTLHKKMLHLRDMVTHGDNELCQAYESLQLQQELDRKIDQDKIKDEIEMLRQFESAQLRKYRKLKRKHRRITELAKQAIDRAVKEQQLPNDEYFGEHLKNAAEDDYYYLRIKHFKMLCFKKALAATAYKSVSVGCGPRQKQKKLQPLEFKLSTYKQRPVGKFIDMSEKCQRVET